MISQDSARYLVVLVFAIMVVAGISLLDLSEGPTGYAIYNASNGTTIFECGNIVEPGTYTLNQSLINTTADCLVIQSNNVILDLGGYTILGADQTKIGVKVNGHYATVRNGIINNQSTGVQLLNSQNTSAYNLTILSSTTGISLNDLSTGADVIYNIFENITINNSETGILFSSPGSDIMHNLFKNINLSFISEKNVSTSIAFATITNNTILNISYGDESYLCGASCVSSQVIRAWYYRTNVTTPDGIPVNNAIVEAYNSTGNLIKNFTTDSTGFTESGENLIDYIRDKTVRSDYSFYNITVGASGYAGTSVLYNVSTNENNLNHEINLTDTTNPAVAAHNISVEYPTNVSVQFNGTDNSAIDYFSVNDTTNFQINRTGYLENITDLTLMYPGSDALYWLNITVNDTANNTVNVEVWVNVSDTTNPTISAHNITEGVGTPVAVQFNATDNAGISNFNLNNTLNFTINSTGYFQTVTNPPVDKYWVNITVNDTANNTATDEIWINVISTTTTIGSTTTANPDLTTIAPTGGTSETTAETSITSTTTNIVNTIESTIPPITTIDLEDVEVDCADMISWNELYSMLEDSVIAPIADLEIYENIVTSVEETLSIFNFASDSDEKEIADETVFEVDTSGSWIIIIIAPVLIILIYYFREKLDKIIKKKSKIKKKRKLKKPGRLFKPAK